MLTRVLNLFGSFVTLWRMSSALMKSHNTLFGISIQTMYPRECRVLIMHHFAVCREYGTISKTHYDTQNRFCY